MADLSSLSDAQAILLACELCSAGNVNPLPRLRQLFPTSLTTERLFRIILSFLPETTPPSHYTPILEDIDRDELSENGNGLVDVSSIKEVREAEARIRVRRLRLLPLAYRSGESAADPLTEFLIHRAHKIDAETGLQTLILDLLLPFYDRSETLLRYLVSLILPLLRANYEYYPDREEKLSLDVFDSLDTTTSINLLLSMTASSTTAVDLAQNLRGLAGPWISGRAQSKRRKLGHAEPSIETKDCSADWQIVNEWLLSRSLVEFENVARGIIDWDGPEDVDSGGYLPEDEASDEKDAIKISYGQAALAIVYATDLGRGSLESSFEITSKVEILLGLDSNLQIEFDTEQLPAFDVDVKMLSTASKALLLQNALLKPNNSLTVPTPQSVGFLQILLVSLRVLRAYGYNTSCRSAATVCLQNGEEAQALEMHGVINMIVKQAKPGQDWRKIREQILWLQDWGSGSAKSEYHGLFWRVSRTAVETEILRAMMTAGEYQVATEIYTGGDSPLDLTQVEAAVVETIVSFYDTASNGNKTRGKMKRAVDTLKAFQSQFPNAKSLQELAALISATHALSFYSLTLQHGVPFQPVSIRVHGDPLSLVETVLEQNSKSYTKLDDLLSIGRDFVAAGLPLQLPGDDDHSRWWKSGRNSKLSQEQKSLLAEKRIVSMAVSSALASDDFGTAYSYILTRLTPPSLMPNSASTSSSPIEDNISWRAAYNAGRHRSTTSPSALASSSSSSGDNHLTAQIAVLSQRLELLSLALTLAPTADPLPEILGAWRRCDEELSTLRDQENQEAEEWDLKGDTTTSTLPGGFGPTDRELDAYENERQQQTRRARARNTHHYLGNAASAAAGEEAPMGLFDVARGAARAFSKNIPLQAGTGRGLSRSGSVTSPTTTGATTVTTTSTTTPGAAEYSARRSSSELLSRSTTEFVEGEDRVRKRDMVSNMVTGGLASGIGWVLGAQPVNNNHDHNNNTDDN